MPTLSLSRVKALAGATVSGVGSDDVPTLAAAIAYYTVFSLPPLLVILVGIAGALFGADAVTERIVGQASSAIGEGAGAEIQTVIENASTLGSGIGAKLVGLVALLFGASGAFGQLQKALNRAWNVEAVAAEGFLKGVVLKRLLSFGMVLTIAFFLLASLVLSAALAALGDAAQSTIAPWLVGLLGQLLNTALSVAVITGLFGVLFRVLPDAEIAWRDVWVGALVTAVLFTVGKTALGLYLGQASPGSAFGAAGSLALLLVWIYYSALILLVGAEFTQAWAEQVGGGIEPEEHGAAEAGAPAKVDPPPKAVHPVAEPRDPAPY